MSPTEQSNNKYELNDQQRNQALGAEGSNLLDQMRKLQQVNSVKNDAQALAEQYDKDKNVINFGNKVASLYSDINTKLDAFVALSQSTPEGIQYMDFVKKYKERLTYMMETMKQKYEYNNDGAQAILSDIQVLNQSVTLWGTVMPSPKDMFIALASNIAMLGKKLGYTEPQLRQEILALHSPDVELGFKVEDVAIDIMNRTANLKVAYQLNKDLKFTGEGTIVGQTENITSPLAKVNQMNVGIDLKLPNFSSTKDKSVKNEEENVGIGGGGNGNGKEIKIGANIKAGQSEKTVKENEKNTDTLATDEDFAKLAEGMKVLTMDERNQLNELLGGVIQKYEVHSSKLTSQDHRNELTNRILRMKNEIAQGKNFNDMKVAVSNASSEITKTVNGWYKYDESLRAITDPKKRKKAARIDKVDLQKGITQGNAAEYLRNLQESTTVASIEKNREVERKVIDFKTDQLNKLTTQLKTLGDEGNKVGEVIQRFFGANDIGMTTSTVEFVRHLMDTRNPQTAQLRNEIGTATGLMSIEEAKNMRLTGEYVAAVGISLIGTILRHHPATNYSLKHPDAAAGDHVSGGLSILGPLVGSLQIGKEKMQMFLTEDTMKMLANGAELTQKIGNAKNPEEKKTYEKQLQNMIDILAYKNGAKYDDKNKKPSVVDKYDEYMKVREEIKNFVNDPKNTDARAKIEKREELDKKAAQFKQDYGIDVSLTGDFTKMLSDTKFDEDSKAKVRAAELDAAGKLSDKAKKYLSSALTKQSQGLKTEQTKTDRGQLELSAQKAYMDVMVVDEKEKQSIDQEMRKLNIDEMQAKIKEKGYDATFEKKVMRRMEKDDKTWSSMLQSTDMAKVDKAAREIVERMRPNAVSEAFSWVTHRAQTKLANDFFKEMGGALAKASILEEKKKIAVQAYAVLKSTEGDESKTFAKVSQQRRADKALSDFISVLNTTDKSAATLQKDIASYENSLNETLKVDNTLAGERTKVLDKFLTTIALVEEMKGNIFHMSRGNFDFLEGTTVSNFNLKLYAKEGAKLAEKYDMSLLRKEIQNATDKTALDKITKKIDDMQKEYYRIDGYRKTINMKKVTEETVMYNEIKNYLKFSEEEMKSVDVNDLAGTLDSINTKLAKIGATNIGKLGILSLLPRVKDQNFNYAQGKDIAATLEKRMDIFDTLLSGLLISGHKNLLKDKELADYLVGLGLKKADVYKSNNTVASYSTVKLIEPGAITEAFKTKIGMKAASNVDVDVADMVNMLHGVLGDRSESRRLDDNKLGKTLDFRKDGTFLSSVMDALSNPRNADLFNTQTNKEAFAKSSGDFSKFFSQADMMAALGRVEKVTDPTDIANSINTGLNFDWKGDKGTNTNGGKSELGDTIFKTALTKTMGNGNTYEFDVFFKQECVNVQLNPASKVRMLKEVYNTIKTNDWGKYSQAMPELKFSVGTIEDDKLTLATYISTHPIIIPAYVFSILGLVIPGKTPPVENKKNKCEDPVYAKAHPLECPIEAKQDCSNPDYAKAHPLECPIEAKQDCSNPEYAKANPDKCNRKEDEQKKGNTNDNKGVGDDNNGAGGNGGGDKKTEKKSVEEKDLTITPLNDIKGKYDASAIAISKMKEAYSKKNNGKELYLGGQERDLYQAQEQLQIAIERKDESGIKLWTDNLSKSYDAIVNNYNDVSGYKVRRPSGGGSDLNKASNNTDGNNWGG